MRHVCDGKIKTRDDSRNCGRFLFEETRTEVVVRCPNCKKEHRIQKAVWINTVQDFIAFIEGNHKPSKEQ